MEFADKMLVYMPNVMCTTLYIMVRLLIHESRYFLFQGVSCYLLYLAKIKNVIYTRRNEMLFFLHLLSDLFVRNTKDIWWALWDWLFENIIYSLSPWNYQRNIIITNVTTTEMIIMKHGTIYDTCKKRTAIKCEPYMHWIHNLLICVTWSLS